MKYCLAIILLVSTLTWAQQFPSEVKYFIKILPSIKIGVGGSAQQVEGAWNISGRSPSNWDVFALEKPRSIADGHAAGVAADTYHKYKEDIELTKNGGFDFYRLSLSWSRILPMGFGGNVSKEGIQYYKNVLDELNKQGIEPYVSIYHWDHPAILDQMGGWLNPMMIDFFTNYAKIVFEELGSRVKFWITINEPNSICLHAYGSGYFAPGIKLPGYGPYICGHNMLKAHAQVYRLYDRTYRQTQKGIISIVNSCMHYYPVNKNDTESPDIAYQFYCGWLSHPIYSEKGDYPAIMRKRIDENSLLEGYTSSRLPTFSADWVEYIKGTYDYYGLNYFTSKLTENVPRSDNNSLWFDDSGVRNSDDPAWPVAFKPWLKIVPEGLRGLLNKIKNEYNNPAVYILENGVPTNSSLNDIDRIEYIHAHIEQTFLAKEQDKCNVQGFGIWSLLDSFEWTGGYTECYGIVHVDFDHPNRTRTPRHSYNWLRRILNDYMNAHNKFIYTNFIIKKDDVGKLLY